MSAPDVVLAAIAGRTSRIRLGSAVTVLSSDDPIRVFQRFSTLDAASNGRAEVILGRGSFTESFPLFGYELSQYEELFEDKLDLFAALIRQERVTWQGKTRPALVDQRVFPPIERGTLKTWIGVGGSPESVVRAVRYDLPLMLAIIGLIPFWVSETVRTLGWMILLRESGVVPKLLVDLGAACAEYQDMALRGLPCTTVECDEIWAYCYSKQKNIPADKKNEPGIGDVWTWVAIDADTKLVPAGI